MYATRAMLHMKQSCLYKKGILYEDKILSASGSNKAKVAQNEIKWNI